MASNEETMAAGSDDVILPQCRVENEYEFMDDSVYKNKLEWLILKLKSSSVNGLPDTSSTYSSVQSTAKEIWDNVEMLMQGSGRTLQQRKEDLFDEYERFRAIGNESIHDYFVRFTKLSSWGNLHEPHGCQKTLKKQEQSTSIVDPLAYVITPTFCTYSVHHPQLPSPQTYAQSPENERFDGHFMTQIANLLSGFQKQFPPNPTTS
ncbi:hypothetical protein Tco_0205886 [Tanacetum coccineum]